MYSWQAVYVLLYFRFERMSMVNFTINVCMNSLDRRGLLLFMVYGLMNMVRKRREKNDSWKINSLPT